MFWAGGVTWSYGLLVSVIHSPSFFMNPFCNNARQISFGKVDVTSRHSRLITLIRILQSSN